MTIGHDHQVNFATMRRAFEDDALALVEVFDTKLDRTSVAVAAIGWDGDEYTITPLALMFEENPFERLQAPDPAGGFYPVEKVGA